jgi:SAM-dependent methyltransferase
LEVYEQNPNLNIYFDCLDHDPNAISYAKALLSDKAGDKCRFVNENIFKFKTDKTYDLVWSAGLFDYFDDKTFVTVLKKLYEAVKPGGKLIIGNFSWESETRFLKVFVDWNLNYRANTDLLGLAELAGIDKTKIQIVSESENVNLFMTISK